MNALAAVANPGNPALAQLVVAVAAGLIVAVLGYIAGMLRRLLREHASEHKWMAEAIKTLLEERRPVRQRKH